MLTLLYNFQICQETTAHTVWNNNRFFFMPTWMVVVYVSFVTSQRGVKLEFTPLFAVVLTRSDRWLSPIVKLCFPAEASRLCWTTECRFLSHTALRKRSSVWKRVADVTVGPLRVNIFPGLFRVLPGCHSSCRAWFSTLATFCSLQKTRCSRPDSAKAPSHSKCTS